MRLQFKTKQKLLDFVLLILLAGDIATNPEPQHWLSFNAQSLRSLNKKRMEHFQVI